MKYKFRFLLFFLFLVSFSKDIFASQSVGTIDPTNHIVHYVHDESGINFGNFTVDPTANITISDEGLRGYAWSEKDGWITMNCLDTDSGCTDANDHFKVSVSANGTLSGFAWGQKTGWINFGPFTASGTPQVVIGSDGRFGNGAGGAGYAWSARRGWIVFDCTTDSDCVTTDYVPIAFRETVTTTGGSGGKAPVSIPSVPEQELEPPISNFPKELHVPGPVETPSGTVNNNATSSGLGSTHTSGSVSFVPISESWRLSQHGLKYDLLTIEHKIFNTILDIAHNLFSYTTLKIAVTKTGLPFFSLLLIITLALL